MPLKDGTLPDPQSQAMVDIYKLIGKLDHMHLVSLQFTLAEHIFNCVLHAQEQREIREQKNKH